MSCNEIWRWNAFYFQDLNRNVFGAYLSDPNFLLREYSGSSETFVFSFSPAFRAYNCSGRNLLIKIFTTEGHVTN